MITRLGVHCHHELAKKAAVDEAGFVSVSHTTAGKARRLNCGSKATAKTWGREKRYQDMRGAQRESRSVVVVREACRRRWNALV